MTEWERCVATKGKRTCKREWWKCVRAKGRKQCQKEYKERANTSNQETLASQGGREPEFVKCAEEDE